MSSQCLGAVKVVCQERAFPCFASVEQDIVDALSIALVRSRATCAIKQGPLASNQGRDPMNLLAERVLLTDIILLLRDAFDVLKGGGFARRRCGTK